MNRIGTCRGQFSEPGAFADRSRSYPAAVKVVLAFSCYEGADAFGDGVPDVVHGSCGGFLGEGLELRECHLDGIEVGAIGRQEARFGAGGLDGRAHGVVSS